MRIPESVPPLSAVASARRHPIRRLSAAVAFSVLMATLCVLVGTGWTDGLRGWGALGKGPLVSGALPLRELAGAGDQPLLRMVAGWVPTGVMAGLFLPAQRPGARAALLGIPFWVLLVAIADCQYAIVHNLPAAQVLVSRAPSAAAFVATACVVAGASLVSVRRS